MIKEEKREYDRKYHEDHKEEIKEYNKKYNRKYYSSHKDKIKENVKKYNEIHKEEIKVYNKKYMESHKEHYKKFNKYQRYVRRNYSRFISLENFITIMKMDDYSSKLSIMIRLGQGTIDENEAVALSGMVFTEEDEKEMKEWYNLCRCNALA